MTNMRSIIIHKHFLLAKPTHKRQNLNGTLQLEGTHFKRCHGTLALCLRTRIIKDNIFASKLPVNCRKSLQLVFCVVSLLWV
uniref:Uncharacterized protein n=1 Tax=Rhizophora mucronata TaxID=61149 RepID=A0A2P2KA83_RHIMU